MTTVFYYYYYLIFLFHFRINDFQKLQDCVIKCFFFDFHAVIHHSVLKLHIFKKMT